MFTSRTRRAVLGGLLAAGAIAAPSVFADDYSDPDYAEFDADTMARSTERQGYHVTSTDY